ncbi:MAG: hypothetical protein EBX37_01260 [Alphaproteobacteria bacterium]|nr:hypothetical protein [Alphaproteobacteria bacterium]
MSSKIITLGFSGGWTAGLLRALTNDARGQYLDLRGQPLNALDDAGRRRLLAQAPDMLIVNAHSPEEPYAGVELARQLRRAGYNKPILLVARLDMRAAHAAEQQEALDNAMQAGTITKWYPEAGSHETVRVLHEMRGTSTNPAPAPLNAAEVVQQLFDAAEARRGASARPARVAIALQQLHEAHRLEVAIGLKSSHKTEVAHHNGLLAEALDAWPDLKKMDVVVLGNTTAQERQGENSGLARARALRKAGYTGRILLLNPPDAQMSPAALEALQAAEQSGVVALDSLRDAASQNPDYERQFVARLDREITESQRSAALAGLVPDLQATVGVASPVDSVRAPLMKLLSDEAHKGRDYRGTVLGDALAGAEHMDVLMVHFDTKADAEALSGTLRDLLRKGYRGKVLALVEEHDIFSETTPETTRIAAQLQREGVVDAALEVGNVQHASNIVGDRLVHAYTEFAQQMDAAWQGALQALQAPKGRWDAEKQAPRAITAAEREEAAEAARSAKASRKAEMKEWEYRYYERATGLIDRWTMREQHSEGPGGKLRQDWVRRDEHFPRVQQIGGGVLNLSEGLSEAQAEVAESGIRFGDKASYDQAVTGAFARRIVDMLAASGRLEGDMAQRPALEAQVRAALETSRARLPMREQPTHAERTLRSLEQQELEANHGAVNASMTARWSERASRALNLPVSRA